MSDKTTHPFEWRRVARAVDGEALPCGHYPEEAPEQLLARLIPFLA